MQFGPSGVGLSPGPHMSGGNVHSSSDEQTLGTSSACAAVIGRMTAPVTMIAVSVILMMRSMNASSLVIKVCKADERGHRLFVTKSLGSSHSLIDLCLHITINSIKCQCIGRELTLQEAETIDITNRSWYKWGRTTTKIDKGIASNYV